jgi:shikimate 5-dehydrogenase
LLGDYTDVEGFLTNIDESADRWAEGAESAFVIGAGTRAVIYAVTSGGFQRFAIVNRTHARGVAIAAEFGGAAVALPWSDLITALSDADLLVNAKQIPFG